MHNQEDYIIRKYRQRFLDQRLRQLDLSLPQGIYLIKIHEYTTVKMNVLIENSPFHKSHATRQIQQLSERGLVEKSVDVDDSRAVVIRITQNGLDLAKDVLKAVEDWESLCNEALTESELSMLAIIKQKTVQHIRHYFEED
jgi:DNA-binding MarR family transcriptional regulator